MQKFVLVVFGIFIMLCYFLFYQDTIISQEALKPKSKYNDNQLFLHDNFYIDEKNKDSSAVNLSNQEKDYSDKFKNVSFINLSQEWISEKKKLEKQIQGLDSIST